MVFGLDDSSCENAMGGANLHTPQSIFQHMMGPQNTTQQNSPWMQMPQVPPLSIPWSVPALQQPELIRFTGEPSYASTLHQKRKLEAPDLIDMRQTKQFITEEKMAAHFKDLHISSNYQPESPVPSTSKADTDVVPPKGIMDLDLEAKAAADGEQQHPRLVLSEEIKSIPQDSIIPLVLLSKLERPTMALVLWEPPSKHLRLLPAQRETPMSMPSVSDDNNNNDANNNNNNNNNSSSNNNTNNSSNNSNNNNNNNEAMPDLNQVSDDNSDRSVFEPMEL